MDGTGGSMDSSREVRHYEIRIKGHLDTRWAAWFDGLSLTHAGDGTTVLRGAVTDQAELHGVLQKLRDLGVALLSVSPVDPDQPAVPPAHAE